VGRGGSRQFLPVRFGGSTMSCIPLTRPFVCTAHCGTYCRLLAAVVAQPCLIEPATCVPSCPPARWAKTSEVQLRVNGRNIAACRGLEDSGERWMRWMGWMGWEEKCTARSEARLVAWWCCGTAVRHVMGMQHPCEWHITDGGRSLASLTPCRLAAACHLPPAVPLQPAAPLCSSTPARASAPWALNGPMGTRVS